MILYELWLYFLICSWLCEMKSISLLNGASSLLNMMEVVCKSLFTYEKR